MPLAEIGAMEIVGIGLAGLLVTATLSLIAELIAN